MEDTHATSKDKGGSNMNAGNTQADAVNYYKLLNITPDATRMEIRDAYLRVKSAFNSENQAMYSIMSEDEARTHLATIDQAYLTLEDETSRERYDRRLKSQVAGSVVKRHVGPAPSYTNSHGGSHVNSYNNSHSGRSHSQFSGGSSMDLLAATMGEGDGFNHPTTIRQVPVIRVTAQKSSAPDFKEALTQMIGDADKGDGDLLRRIREACGVTMEEMQERTKILADYIRGIEENRFDRLPPIVYVRGFIRSYLKYLAIPDPERFAVAYALRMEEWRSSARN